MLNIEKYRKVFETCDISDFMIINGEIFRCDGSNCEHCLFNNCSIDNCYLNRLNWLLEEYKEPILTDEAKNYLKLILEPSKCTTIQKLMNDEETHRKYKLLCGTDSGYIAILYKPGTKYYEYFKYMENDKEYTPDELGLKE